MPETSARSAPWRTTSAPARPPASSCSASTRIDLPAPVSPVSTVSPGRSSSSTASMMAKSRICRCVSMRFSARSCRGPSAAWSAAAEVIVAGRVQQRDALARRVRTSRRSAGVKSPSTTPSQVTCAWVSARSMQAHLDDRGGGDHDRPVREGVRADRRDHQHRQVRLDDRAAAGERVGGRAGGGGDDDAVAAVGVDEAPVDAGLEVEHAPGLVLLQHHVVERQCLATPRPPAHVQARRQQRPLVALRAPRRGPRRPRRSMSCGMTSVRKPRRPRLTPSSGTPWRATRRAAYSSVPSPPTAITRSARVPNSLLRHALRDRRQSSRQRGVLAHQHLHAAAAAGAAAARPRSRRCADRRICPLTRRCAPERPCEPLT